MGRIGQRMQPEAAGIAGGIAAVPGLAVEQLAAAHVRVARQVQQLALYRQAAEALGINAGDSDMRRSQLLDGKTWDGSDPAGYARSFHLHALADDANRQALR